ncbi:MAG: universal stress protein [Gammaproteobacteria bacterium]
MNAETSTHDVAHAQKILVAVDGSSNSTNALNQAIALAQPLGASITLITVIDMYIESMSVAVDMEEELSREARTVLDDDKALVESAGVTCADTIVHMGGEPHAFIVDEAKAHHVDLIVVGSHGRTGLSRLLHGSVSESVIGHAPCPVLVVPSSE